MEKLEMKAWFEKLLAGCDLEYKAVFGNPTWLCNGNMFAKIEKDKFVLRLALADKEALMKQIPQVEKYIMFNGMHGKDYVTFGTDLCPRAADLKPWVKKGFATIKKVPPKVKK